MVLKPTASSISPYEMFENDVEMYGAQTSTVLNSKLSPFENDVEMYGAQTVISVYSALSSLRMM